jgi:PleD family two-component response regulator
MTKSPNEPPAGTPRSKTAHVRGELTQLTPPRVLVVARARPMREELSRRASAAGLQALAFAVLDEALDILRSSPRTLLLTDSLDLIRRMQAMPLSPQPFIAYVSEADTASERGSGIAIGADDCIGRRASAHEWHARLSNARRLVALETAPSQTAPAIDLVSAYVEAPGPDAFGPRFSREVQRAIRYRRPICLILCQVAQFDSLAEKLGSHGVSEVLNQALLCMGTMFRHGSDWVSLVDHDKISVVLPETDHVAACIVASRLRSELYGYSFGAGQDRFRLPFVMGMCSVSSPATHNRFQLAHAMQRAADSALQQSKGDGGGVTAVRIGSSSGNS